MNKWMQAIATGMVLLLSAHGALAAGEGFYVGVGAGKGLITNGSGTATELKSDAGYSGLVGYRIGIIPLFDFSVEGQYTDFGNFKPDNSAVAGTAEASAYGANGLAILPIGPIDFYGKVGIARLSFKSTVGGTNIDVDSTTPVYGVGVGLRVVGLGVRLQADYFDTDKQVGDNMLVYSVIASWTF